MPPAKSQTRSPVPPVASIFALYPVFSVPTGNKVVVITGGFSLSLTKIARPCSSVRPRVSVARTLKSTVPTVVGVPVIAPVEVVSVRPDGRAPVTMLHVTAPFLLVAASVPLYGSPTLPPGKVVVVISGGMGPSTIVMNRAFSVLRGIVSVARTVKLNGPTVVGVPVMAPVVLFKVRPGGRLPAETLQVTAPVPPVAVRV